jgi:hypothetical protein
MASKAKLILGVTSSLIIVAAAVLWVSGPHAGLHVTMQALRECLHPTTVVMMPLPEGCTPTSEMPPEKLMVMMDQRQRANFTLQRVIVCRTKERLPNGPPELMEGASGAGTHTRWLLWNIAIRVYQFRRHVTVVAFNVDENGTLIGEAAFIQGRWSYLRSHWDDQESYSNWY